MERVVLRLWSLEACVSEDIRDIEMVVFSLPGILLEDEDWSFQGRVLVLGEIDPDIEDDELLSLSSVYEPDQYL